MNAWQGYDLIKAGAAGLCGPRAPVDGQANQLISYADLERGVVHIIGRGLWDETMVDEHFAALTRTAAFVRRHAAAVRVLVDLRAAAVQSLAVARQVRLHTKAVWTDRDRIAVVVSPGLPGSDPDRPTRSVNQATFTTIPDARAWLNLPPQSDSGVRRPIRPADRATAVAR